MKLKGSHYQAQQGDEVLVASVNQQQKLAESSVALVALLKACAKRKDLFKGIRVHADIVRRGLLEKNVYIGSTLVNMYAKCGALAKAQQVFDELPVQDKISWTTLIAGYAQNGHGKGAINCFEQMQLGGLFPDSVTFTCILKACSSVRASDKGQEIHAEIVRKGLLGKDIVVGTALVDMYAKCGALDKAREVFDELLVRDTVLWNALIAGYAQHGHGKDAISCFDRMQLEGLFPDAATFSCILKACGSIGNTFKGQEVHSKIVGKGLLENNNFIGNALVDMYAKCGVLAKAQKVFEELPARDLVSWNALIAGYARHSHDEEALHYFEHMHLEDLSPDTVTFSCILKVCGSIGALDKGQEIHAEIVRQNLLGAVGNSLVDMYAKCGALAKAQEVFEELPVRDAVSWTAIIIGYAQHGHGQQAIDCFDRMQLKGLAPDAVTFGCILKACGSIGALTKGQEIHSMIVREGLLEKHLAIGNALVDMYAKCGALAKAQKVFDELPVRDVVSWNALISGYVQHECGEEAIKYFERMRLGGPCPDEVTFGCVLKACGSIGSADRGKEIHEKIAKGGLLGKSSIIGTALIGMYAKCGALAKAQEVFDELEVQDVISWTALLAGYAQHGHANEALNCFEQMQLRGFAPDVVTISSILKVCGSIGDVCKGLEIHGNIVKEGFLEDNNIVSIALVDMYAKCGALTKAQEVFDQLPVRDAVLWNALITGYAQHGHGEEAISCFEQMQAGGLSPDAVTFACILKVCGSMGAAYKGQEVHAKIAREGLLGNSFVRNALVDMYAKCGAVAKAQKVFAELPKQDAVSWNALLAGYAQLGKDAVVFDSFNKMIAGGEKPDLLTFSILLYTCSHSGQLNKGEMYFESMSTMYGIVPNVEHYVRMVDLFGRAGHLDKVTSLLNRMPFFSNLSVWLIVLGACRKWGNVKLARLAFEHAVQLDEKEDAAYICMSNVYADAGMRENADSIEAMRVKKKGWGETRTMVEIRSMHLEPNQSALE